MFELRSQGSLSDATEDGSGEEPPKAAWSVGNPFCFGKMDPAGRRLGV